MPICQSCHEKWSWKQTAKKSFIVIDGMKCPYCAEKQYLTARMRKRSAIGPVIIIPLAMLSYHFFDLFYGLLFTILVLLPLVLVINPFFVELSNEEEPLF